MEISKNVTVSSLTGSDVPITKSKKKGIIIYLFIGFLVVSLIVCLLIIINFLQSPRMPYDVYPKPSTTATFEISQKYYYYEATHTDTDNTYTIFEKSPDGTTREIYTFIDQLLLAYFDISKINDETLGIVLYSDQLGVNRRETESNFSLITFYTLDINSNKLTPIRTYQSSENDVLVRSSWIDNNSVLAIIYNKVFEKLNFRAMLFTSNSEKTLASYDSMSINRGNDYHIDSNRATISPDKKKVLITTQDFINDEGVVSTLFYDLNGNLITTLLNSFSPEWIDDVSIAYTKYREGNLYSYNIVTKESTLLLNTSARMNYGIRYLDGNLIYFRESETDISEVFLFNISSKKETLLSKKATAPIWVDSSTIFITKVTPCIDDGEVGCINSNVFDGIYTLDINTKSEKIFRDNKTEEINGSVIFDTSFNSENILIVD